MLILLLFIFTGAFIFCVVKESHQPQSKQEEGFWIGAIASLLALLFTGAFLIGCLVNLKKTTIIEDKIAIFQDENSNIEIEMQNIINTYLNHEEKIFSVNEDDFLFNIPPDLKSDLLVTIQIETYLDNRAVIKDLKTQLLNRSIYKWWLFFGN